MFVEVGSRVAIRDLLMGMIVQSGNDASVALAEHVAGSESVFAETDESTRAATRHAARVTSSTQPACRPTDIRPRRVT